MYFRDFLSRDVTQMCLSCLVCIYQSRTIVTDAPASRSCGEVAPGDRVADEEDFRGGGASVSLSDITADFRGGGASVSLSDITDITDAASCQILDFLAPGAGLGRVAAVSSHWASATQHPELWWRVCTRGPSSLVKMELGFTAHDIQGSSNALTWPLLARLCLNVERQGWAGEVPPGRLLRMLQDVRSGRRGWTGLATMTACGCGNAAASDFLPCRRYFPSGGFQFSLESEDGPAPQKNGTDLPAFGRFWLRLTDAPSGPLSLRALLMAPSVERGSASVRSGRRELGAIGELQSVELVADFRGGAANLAWRYDGSGAAAEAAEALSALTCALVACEPVHAVIHVDEPPDTDGKPGGGGWIPWAPRRPAARFAVHAFP